jgi:hypothetical protein
MAFKSMEGYGSDNLSNLSPHSFLSQQNQCLSSRRISTVAAVRINSEQELSNSKQASRDMYEPVHRAKYEHKNSTMCKGLCKGRLYTSARKEAITSHNIR